MMPSFEPRFSINMQTSLPGQVSVGCAPRTRIYDCLTRRASCCDVTILPLDSLRNYVLLHPAPNLRQPILTHPEVRSALREAIEHVRESLPFTIDAWILLPDHLHAIWTLPQSDAAYG